MSNLALTYAALGRHRDALGMHEKIIEFRRRVLPENYRDICAVLLLRLVD
jgi:hypothetical protein